MKTMYRVTIYGFTHDSWNQTKFTENELINLPFEKGFDYGSTSIGDYGTFEALEEALAAFETAKQDVYPVSCEQTNIKNHYSISFDVLQLEKFTVDEDDEEDNFEVIKEFAKGNA